MKKGVLTAMVLLCSIAKAGDFASTHKSVAMIWPDIVFIQGADFNNFNATIQQTRDQVRQMLMEEFGDTAMPMVMMGADATSLAPVLANILLTFDQMYEIHRHDAFAGVPQSLDGLFKAAFEAQFTRYGIPESARKVAFVRDPSLLQAAQEGRRAGHPMATDKAVQAILNVDYVLYGVVSVADGAGNVSITLTLENYRSGEARTFSAGGEIQLAVQDLAAALFNFFQGQEYQEWKNPQPQLQWIPAAPGTGDVLAGTAKIACKSQGARIPFARELIMASATTQFHEGGIPILAEHEKFVVADKQRHNEQYYYFTDGQQYPGGPVRSAAGFGTVIARYWCVKGPVSDDVREVENLYAILRKNSDPEVAKAIEYILTQMGDYGANPHYVESFADLEAAESLLRSKGILL